MRVLFGPRHEKTCILHHDTISLLPKVCGCTAWFVTDLVGNPEISFSRDAAHSYQKCLCIKKASTEILVINVAPITKQSDE